MIITPLHPIMLPLAVAIWSVDAFLWIVLIRLLLSRLPRFWAASASWGLAAITDPTQLAVRRWILRLTGHFCSSWLCWTILIVCLLVAHHLLVWLAIATR